MTIQNDGFEGTAQEYAAVEAAVVAAVAKVDAIDGSAPEAASKVRSANVLSMVRIAGIEEAPTVDLIYSAIPRYAGTEATAPLLAHAAFLGAALLSEVGSVAVSVNGVAVTTDPLGVADYAALGDALGF